MPPMLTKPQKPIVMYYYIRRAKVSDIQTKRFPLWEDVNGLYTDCFRAHSDAASLERQNPDYRYEVDCFEGFCN